MPVKYGQFELPNKIKIEESEGDTYARFVAEAFERGFGHSVGNMLRRIMLTAMEAPAIVSVKLEGVLHEFTAIDGVIEDMTHVVLNLKNALLRKLPTDDESNARGVRIITNTIEVTPQMIEDGGGQYVVTLGDIAKGGNFEVVNPNHKIFTVTKPLSKRISLKVAIGRGYVPSERHNLRDKSSEEIAIDSCFSPVRLVNYFVENTRVGRDTDFDRLVLEVTTDGRISPKEAISFATQIGVTHLTVFDELKFHELVYESSASEQDSDRDAMMGKLSRRIDEIELSVRSANCLTQADIETIAELVVMSEPDLLRCRNFGKKSLTEIREKLDDMGLSLGMDLSRFNINTSNVKEVISQYRKENAGKEPVQYSNSNSGQEINETL